MTITRAPHRLRGSIFALAIFLTIAGSTQLRFGQSPIGVGEVALILWCAYCLHKSVGANGLMLPYRFIIIFALVQCVSVAGMVMSAIMDIDSKGSMLHNYIAYNFTFTILAFYLIYSARNSENIFNSFAVGAIVAFSVLGIPIWLGYQYGIDFGFELTRHGVRFQGLAENPNQTALYVVAIPFFIVATMRVVSGVSFRMVILLALLVVCILYGYSTGSDALTAAWIGSGTIFLLLLFYNTLGTKLNRTARAVVITPVVTAVLATLAWKVWGSLDSYALYVYSEGGQGATRIALWGNAFHAGLSSPLVGLGPGSFSGYRHAFEGKEAHNTFFDLFSSSGVMGVSFFVAFLGYIGLHSWRTRRPEIIGLFFALTFFSFFHFVARHPIFWVILIVILSVPRYKTQKYRKGIMRDPRPSFGY